MNFLLCYVHETWIFLESEDLFTPNGLFKIRNKFSRKNFPILTQKFMPTLGILLEFVSCERGKDDLKLLKYIVWLSSKLSDEIHFLIDFLLRKIENKSGLIRVVFMDHKLLGLVSVEVDGQPLSWQGI